eukprot:217309_1
MPLHTKLFDIHFLNSIHQAYGVTPCYIYSQELIESAIKQYQKAFGSHRHSIHYAVKANSNLSILSIIKQSGCGFDIVSIGELNRCLSIGVDPKHIIFSGVGKTDHEIKTALQLNIGCLNCESIEEIFLVNSIAQSMDKIAKIGLRVNPHINTKTHPYISTGLESNKFGLTIQDTRHILQCLDDKQLPNISVIGLGFHIGSQLMDVSPIVQSITSVLPLIDAYESVLSDCKIHHIDIGGGLGINYNMKPFKTVNATDDYRICNVRRSLNQHELYEIFDKNIFQRIDMFINAVKDALRRYPKYRDLAVVCEPGRSIVAYAGVLLTKILFYKRRMDRDKDFVIVDASMSEFIRPALYGGKHPIVLLKDNNDTQNEKMRNVDIVGSVCESGDFLGQQRRIYDANRNDLLAICHCGAYGFSMSSNYNSRCKVTELLIDRKNRVRVIKPRRTTHDLYELYHDEMELLASKL